MSSFALFRVSILQCNCELQSFGNGSVRTGLKAAKTCLCEKNSRSRTPQHICGFEDGYQGVIKKKNANDAYNVIVNVRLVDHSRMHVKAPTAAAIRSMCDLGALQTQPDVIDWESILRREENRSTRKKPSESG